MSQYHTFLLTTVRKQNTGLYTSLPIPHATWKDISIDFVLNLPKISRTHDSILVMVDKFSKMAQFIANSTTHYASAIALSRDCSVTWPPRFNCV